MYILYENMKMESTLYSIKNEMGAILHFVICNLAALFSHYCVTVINGSLE